ncbi:DNA-processing protein DprA [Acidobacteriota bacterium]
MTVPENLVGWIGLSLVFHEKLASFQKILRAFSPIGDVYHARIRDLKALGVEEDAARQLLAPATQERARKELDRLDRAGFGVLTWDDEGYPERLREIYDPPAVLYYAGRSQLLEGPGVSVVGAREPTPYGRAVAEKLASDLAERGVVVISGLARGIDATAHWGALRTGSTAAVLGSGLDVVYPRENRKLWEKIAEEGVVITEYPLGSRPLQHHFPLRNRIISGLALAVVVVEAASRSGSLITARLALEQNREVQAVPGNITSELSRGANWLIKSGARLVEGWEDVIEELPVPWREELRGRIPERPTPPPALTAAEKSLLDQLRPDELRHVDELVDETRLSVSEVLAHLLSLELKGCVSPRPGQYYQRKM